VIVRSLPDKVTARGFAAEPVLVDVNQIHRSLGTKENPPSDTQPEESFFLFSIAIRRMIALIPRRLHRGSHGSAKASQLPSGEILGVADPVDALEPALFRWDTPNASDCSPERNEQPPSFRRSRPSPRPCTLSNTSRAVSSAQRHPCECAGPRIATEDSRIEPNCQFPVLGDRKQLSILQALIRALPDHPHGAR